MNRLVATMLLTSWALCGQTNRGSIAGTIMDQTKAAVAGAKITITNLGTNEVRKLTSTENGSYSAVDLEPVNYSVQVEAAGFKKALVENVKVDTASVAPVNIVLEPGSIDTKITVTAEAAMVNTESGTTSQTITEREIQDVPLLNRSVLDLALTLPNVSGDAGSEDPVLV